MVFLGQDELRAGQGVAALVHLVDAHFEGPVVDLFVRGLAGALAVGVVAVLQMGGVVLFAIVIDLGVRVQNAGVVDVQLVALRDLAILHSLQDIHGDGEGVAVGGQCVVIGAQRIACIVYLDGHVGSALDVGGQTGGHGIADLVGIRFIAGGIGHGGDGTELHGVADLVVAHNAPGIIVVVLDLLFKARLFALRLGGHVADHLHDVGGVEIVLIAQGVVLVLDQIVAGGEAGDGVAAAARGAFGRILQILGDLLRKRLGVRFVFQARRLLGRIAQRGFALIGHAAAPGDVGQDLVSVLLGQIAREDLIRLIGVAGFVVCDGDGVGLRGEGGDAERQRQNQRQQQGKCAFDCFHHT